MGRDNGAPLSRLCRRCNAPVGEPCRWPNGETREPHAERAADAIRATKRARRPRRPAERGAR